MNLRIRGPSGTAAISIDSSASVAQFQQLLAEKTGIKTESQEILVGFPPRPLTLRADQASSPLTSLPIANGDTVVVRVSADAAVRDTTPAQPARAVFEQHENGGESPEDEEEMIQKAIALSLAGSQRNGNGHGAHVRTTPAPAPARPRDADKPAVVRREVPSDNSCLFNAVGYVMEHSRGKAAELRQVIAAAVLTDLDTFSEAFLGRPNEEYSEWIMHPDHWGGAIELSILSKYYGREIAAFDIQTCRCDRYGQGKGYTEVAMVIYDGIHYDALAMSPFDGAPEDLDTTIFAVPQFDDRVHGLALASVVRVAHAAKAFTDVSGFSLRCTTCQKGLRGNREATEHAKSTGHANFAEY